MTTRNSLRSDLPSQMRSPVATPPRGSEVSRRKAGGAARLTHNPTPDITRYRARIQVLKAVWLIAFLALIFVPLVIAPEAGGERRPWSKGGIWVELCMTSGLLGLSALAATVILPSRVKSITESFGIEQVLRSHKWLALATTVIVIAHVVFILIDNPMNVLVLSPMSTGANRARAGLIALVAMILLCVLSFRRRKMGTRYDVWRWVHALLAVAALVGTYMHIYWLNHLMQNVAERTVFYAILVAVSAIMINRWVRRPFASLRNAYVVKQVFQETPTVSTLVLRPARRRQRPMMYRPGQFAWIRLDSPFGPLQGNPFSIASGIDSPRDIEFTIRKNGDFSGGVEALTPGRKVYIDGPYGSFNDDAVGASSLLLIAGGVGLSPMMSILRSHAFRGDPRRHCLVMATRKQEELFFREELDQLSEHIDLDVVEVLSAPPPDWTGASGRVDKELLAEILDEYDLADPRVFICGPPVMMHDVKDALVELGIAARQVETEDFDMV